MGWLQSTVFFQIFWKPFVQRRVLGQSVVRLLVQSGSKEAMELMRKEQRFRNELKSFVQDAHRFTAAEPR